MSYVQKLIKNDLHPATDSDVGVSAKMIGFNYDKPIVARKEKIKCVESVGDNTQEKCRN